jgi:hypothetical protein
MDTVGEILWYAMFLTPIITVPLFLKYNTSNTKTIRVILGLLAAFALSFIFFIIVMGIALRNGLGPT